MPARANEWHFHVLNPLAGTSKCAIHSYPSSLRYACLLPVSLFWTSSSGIPQKQSTAGARYAANNINHILEEASQATQTAVNIAGKECNLEEQYQLGTEAALKPHLRTIIILKQGIVWCTSLPRIGSCCLVFLFSRTVIYCWLQQSTPLIDYLSCSIRTNLQIRAFWLR